MVGRIDKENHRFSCGVRGRYGHCICGESLMIRRIPHSPRAPQAAHRRARSARAGSVGSAAAGFTLVKMMIVVTIVGVMATLVGPGLNAFMADSRSARAAEDLVRLVRHTRARVQHSRLAHLMLFEADHEDVGRVRVWEGMNDHCRTTPWELAIDGTAAQGHAPVDVLDMLDYNSGSSRITLTARQGATSTTNIDNVAVCFQPNGQTLESLVDTAPADFSVTAVATTFTQHRQSYIFTVELEGGRVPREVLLPPGGMARMRL